VLLSALFSILTVAVEKRDEIRRLLKKQIDAPLFAIGSRASREAPRCCFSPPQRLASSRKLCKPGVVVVVVLVLVVAPSPQPPP
jgi:hypothetical protein